MAKYQSLLKMKYNGRGRTLSDNEIHQEYQRRYQSWSAHRTEMFPVLNNYRNRYDQSQRYPLFYTLTKKMESLLTDFGDNSLEIKELIQYLPVIAQQTYIRQNLVEEIYRSNEIEGVKTNRYELNTIASELVEGTGPVKRGRRLLSTVLLYLDSIEGRPISIHETTDYRTLYDELLRGEIPEESQPDGRLFRNSEVYVGSATQVRHVPVSSEGEIEQGLSSLIDYMKEDKSFPVIKGIVSHFIFENVHPFLDGNGRIGRYLLSAYLSEQVDMYTGMAISSAIFFERSRYYTLFKEAGDVLNFADLTMFIEGLLAIIVSGQERVITDLKQRKQELEEARKKLMMKMQSYFQNWTLSDCEEEFVAGILSLLLQSQMFENDFNQGLKLQKIVTRLKKDYRFPEVQVRRICHFLEEKGLLIRQQNRPVRYTLADDLHS
ncbi:Fic family protein [Fructobacillus durionis]|uniref:Fic family protein n=1 Tax=Fructobacillus durionis TaxID=283737 RepID=A0A1I1G9R7_9LACO|nr:Fic family protein [Fructobacillus durionis]SFC05900.1 Fic family protein [Fructobacillus durionis]